MKRSVVIIYQNMMIGGCITELAKALQAVSFV